VVGNIGGCINGDEVVLPYKEGKVFRGLFGCCSDGFCVTVGSRCVWSDDGVEVSEEYGVAHCRQAATEVAEIFLPDAAGEAGVCGVYREESRWC
jgi:hypothetical protein